MKIRRIIFLAIFLATATIYVLFPELPILLSGELFLVFPILSILLALYVSRIYRFNNANGRVQILIAASLACWGIGAITEYVLYNLMNYESPLSLADVFYLLNVPIFAAGTYQGYVISEIKLNQVSKKLLTILLSASFALTGLVLYFGVYQAYDPTADLAVNIVTISYGVTDLVLAILALLTFLVTREYKGGKLASFWIVTTAGSFSFLIADVVYAMYPNIYEQGINFYAYTDLLWITAALFLSFALLENYINISTVQKNIRLKLLQQGK